MMNRQPFLLILIKEALDKASGLFDLNQAVCLQGSQPMSIHGHLAVIIRNHLSLWRQAYSQNTVIM